MNSSGIQWSDPMTYEGSLSEHRWGCQGLVILSVCPKGHATVSCQSAQLLLVY